MDIDALDRRMMSRCIELSRIGAAAGELPMGSLIARDGRIVSEATNEIMRDTDESRHAEIVAIARARKLIGDDELRNCTLYCTVGDLPDVFILHPRGRHSARGFCDWLAAPRWSLAMENSGRRYDTVSIWTCARNNGWCACARGSQGVGQIASDCREGDLVAGISQHGRESA
jgi:hypothetical protein